MTEQEEEKKITPVNPKESEKDPIIIKKGDYRAFIKFYSLPSIYRQGKYGYRTEQDFAKKYNLCQDTLTDWKKRKEFNNDVDIQLAKWGSDKTPDVIAALYRTILKDGKASEVKLWLQYIKRWKEGMILEQSIETKENPLIDLLDKLDEPTRNRVLAQLEANRTARERGNI